MARIESWSVRAFPKVESLTRTALFIGFQKWKGLADRTASLIERLPDRTACSIG
ncbi:hypothetical protein HanRHA438_Chr12g0574451 [Helianthus annuus]|nr:hypothetical protein HanRHA438_Chr12g0574451 [Helianthus annuus]